MAAAFAENPVYRQYERLLRQLHALIAAGQGDEAEADDCRDEMDQPWARITDAERDRLDGLSADLYALQDQEILLDSEGDEHPERLERRLEEALIAGRWDELLALLRRRPRHLSPVVVAALRGTAYGELGHWEVALEFLEYALAREPDHPGLRYQVLHALARCGRAAEALRRGHDWPGASGADLPWLIEYAALAAAEDAGPERAFLRDAEARLREAAARGASAELFRTAA